MIDRMRDVDMDYESAVGQARERAQDIAASAKERFSQGSEFVRKYTVEQPARALCVALGMGVLLGWVIKRR